MSDFKTVYVAQDPGGSTVVAMQISAKYMKAIAAALKLFAEEGLVFDRVLPGDVEFSHGFPGEEPPLKTPLDDAIEIKECVEDIVPMLHEKKILDLTPAMVQRLLRVAYTKASRIIDRLEADGVVGPYRGDTQGREVLLWKETSQAEGSEQPADEASAAADLPEADQQAAAEEAAAGDGQPMEEQPEEPTMASEQEEYREEIAAVDQLNHEGEEVEIPETPLETEEL